jgi:hypothetical protein
VLFCLRSLCGSGPSLSWTGCAGRYGLTHLFTPSMSYTWLPHIAAWTLPQQAAVCCLRHNSQEHMVLHSGGGVLCACLLLTACDAQVLSCPCFPRPSGVRLVCIVWVCRAVVLLPGCDCAAGHVVFVAWVLRGRYLWTSGGVVARRGPCPCPSSCLSRGTPLPPLTHLLRRWRISVCCTRTSYLCLAHTHTHLTCSGAPARQAAPVKPDPQYLCSQASFWHHHRGKQTPSFGGRGLNAPMDSRTGMQRRQLPGLITCSMGVSLCCREGRCWLADRNAWLPGCQHPFFYLTSSNQQAGCV